MLLSDILQEHEVHIINVDFLELDSLLSRYSGFSIGRWQSDPTFEAIICWLRSCVEKFPRKSHVLLNNRLLFKAYRGTLPMSWMIFDDSGKPIAGESVLNHDDMTFLNRIITELVL